MQIPTGDQERPLRVSSGRHEGSEVAIGIDQHRGLRRTRYAPTIPTRLEDGVLNQWDRLGDFRERKTLARQARFRMIRQPAVCLFSLWLYTGIAA
jgi:hypothetical protein